MGLRAIVRNITPKFIRRTYRYMREQFIPVRLAAPVVQMYINDEDIQTTAGFNNFLSFLAAGMDSPGKLHVVLRDSDGRVLVDQTSRLNHFESKFLDIRALLEMRGVDSQLGLISLMFEPDYLHHERYKKLGLLASHFFMFYKGAQGGIAMLHPSSTLDPKSLPSGPFVTNQIIETIDLEAITLYQCNPSQMAYELTIGLQDAETKEVVCSQALCLPPLGVREVSFVAGEEFARNGRALRAFTTSLPTANSKPMLRRCYSGGRFSMSHS